MTFEDSAQRLTLADVYKFANQSIRFIVSNNNYSDKDLAQATYDLKSCMICLETWQRLPNDSKTSGPEMTEAVAQKIKMIKKVLDMLQEKQKSNNEADIALRLLVAKEEMNTLQKKLFPK